MTDTSNTELKNRFFDGMSYAACTVNVVTTDGPAGSAGVTVSAMVSVSADTPLPSLLVCIHHKSPAAGAILENQVFCVNVLRDDQSFISDTFAGRLKTEDGDKFSCTNWKTGKTGAPRVDDPLVAFDCRLMNCERVGTHWVIFGSVEDIFVAERGSPLIYANRAYGTSVPIAPTRPAVAGGEIEVLRLGCYRTFSPYIVPELVYRLLDEHPSAQLQLQEGEQGHLAEGLRAGTTEIALLYDIDLGPGLTTEPLTEIRPYVLLPQGHRLATHAKLTVADIAAEPFILLDAATSRDYFLSIFESAGVEPNIRFRSGSFETVRGLVGHRLGYSILATKPASNMTYDGRALVTLPLDVDVSGSRVVMAIKENAHLSPIAAAFAASSRDFFRTSAA